MDNDFFAVSLTILMEYTFYSERMCNSVLVFDVYLSIPFSHVVVVLLRL